MFLAPTLFFLAYGLLGVYSWAWYVYLIGLSGVTAVLQAVLRWARLAPMPQATALITLPPSPSLPLPPPPSPSFPLLPSPPSPISDCTCQATRTHPCLLDLCLQQNSGSTTLSLRWPSQVGPAPPLSPPPLVTVFPHPLSWPHPSSVAVPADHCGHALLLLEDSLCRPRLHPQGAEPAGRQTGRCCRGWGGIPTPLTTALPSVLHRPSFSSASRDCLTLQSFAQHVWYIPV